jgi:flagellar motor switch protein FliM
MPVPFGHDGQAQGMTDGRSQTVLKRKVEAGRPAADAFAMSPQKALRQALAKTAQDLLEMPLSMTGWTETRMSLAELPETLEERALLAILEGPGESLGLIGIAPAVLAGLTEMQTMGRLGGAEVAPRRPTRTDAAMTADFIDRTLADFGEFLAEEPEVTWAAGFRYASWLEDPRPLGLILEDTTYRVIRVTVDLGSTGTRSGQVLICVPAQGRGPKPRPKPVPADAPAAVAPADWGPKIEQTLMGATVQINAVLYRIDLPIAEILALRTGSVLPVPMAALEQLDLEGVDGRVLAHGRLGQTAGFRAVRMTLADAGEDGVPAAPAAPSMGFSAGKPPVPAAASAVPPPARARAVPPPQPFDLDLGAVPGPAADGGLAPPGDFPAMGGLPPLGDFPAMGDLPPLGELPPLGALPPLGGDDDELPDLGAFPMKAANF